jgi:hypothetical protein
MPCGAIRGGGVLGLGGWFCGTEEVSGLAMAALARGRGGAAVRIGSEGRWEKAGFFRRNSIRAIGIEPGRCGDVGRSIDALLGSFEAWHQTNHISHRIGFEARDGCF